MMPASTQTVDKIIFSKSILIPSIPAFVGFFVCGMMGRFNNGFVSNGKRNVKEYV